MKQSSKKSDIDQSLVVAIFTKKSHTATLMTRITEKSLKKPLKILIVEVIGPWERMLRCLGQVKKEWDFRLEKVCILILALQAAWPQVGAYLTLHFTELLEG